MSTKQLYVNPLDEILKQEDFLKKKYKPDTCVDDLQLKEN